MNKDTEVIRRVLNYLNEEGIKHRLDIDLTLERVGIVIDDNKAFLEALDYFYKANSEWEFEIQPNKFVDVDDYNKVGEIGDKLLWICSEVQDEFKQG